MDTTRTAYRSDQGLTAVPLAGREVVVGYDGTSTSGAAVRWAAAEAARLGSPLTVLFAGDFPVQAGWSPTPTVVPPELRAVAAGVAAQGEALARAVAPDLLVRARGVIGRPALELISDSADAGLLVVGRRHRSEVAAAVLGSVSFAVSLHARCPVVVVQEGADREPAQAGLPVVVGVDGSSSSTNALATAAEIAEEWGAALHVVSAWGIPAGEAWAVGLAYAAGSEIQSAAGAAVRRDLDAAVEAVRRSHPALVVTSTAVEGDAAPTLVEQSRDAALVVVGSRGHGGFAGMMLGSVSHAVLRSAHSPVAVVRRGSI